MKKIMVSITVFAVILMVICAGCTVSKEKQAGSKEDANAPDVAENPSTVVEPKNPLVMDQIYVQYLLDKTMAEALSDEEWAKHERSFGIKAKNLKNSATWNPKIVLGLGSTPGIIYHGFEKNAPPNSFYAGPLVLWWKEKPEGEVYYETYFQISTGGQRYWREEPYEYGIQTYSDPPPEVVEALSNNGVKLIY